jgi:hypothetical protein
VNSPISSTACSARWATPPVAARETLLGPARQIAQLLGFGLMPWQEQVIGGATEQVDGRLVYRQVGVTVPRQSGKSTMILVLLVAHCLARPDTRCIYSAQTRLDARRMLLDEWWPRLAGSKLAPLVQARRGAGAESLWFKNNSRISLVSSSVKAGHGQTVDVVVLDEAWSQLDDRLEASLRPAMITRADPQFYVVSTAGTGESLFLRGKVDDGRARAEMGLTDTYAYFEWSAPDDADLADPVVWRSCMPALGVTVDVEAIRADVELMPPTEARRAYLNQWPGAGVVGWQVIPRETWEALQAPAAPSGQIALAADVTPQRDSGAVAAAWRRSDGHRDVELIDHKAGTAWMVPRITDLARKHRPCAVVVDVAGPAGSLLGELEAAGVEVVRPSLRDLVAACGLFFDMCADSRTLRHTGHPDLDAALCGAAKRQLGDGWAWARRQASSDISPLIAATLAVWAHDKYGRTRVAPYDLLRSIA